MDVKPLELLKFFLTVIEIAVLLYSLKKERVLIASLNKNDQHLKELEKRLRD
jgi:hypothetical protein